MRGSRSIGVGGAAAAAAAALLASNAADAGPQPKYGWREVWAGADVSSHVWLLYSGATVAPYGHVYSDGLRLRIAGGYGKYSYVGTRNGELNAFHADTAYGEALVGYQMGFGPLTAKAFVGLIGIEHDVAPFDPDNPVRGQKLGPKIATELWLNMGTDAWSSLDLSWTTAFNTAAARLRTGYRIYDDVSLGVEGGINANDQGEDARIGLFTRYAWDGGEISVASGFSGRFLEDAQALRDPYVTANWLTQF